MIFFFFITPSAKDSQIENEIGVGSFVEVWRKKSQVLFDFEWYMNELKNVSIIDESVDIHCLMTIITHPVPWLSLIFGFKITTEIQF